MAVQKKTGDRFGVVQTWNAMGVAWNHMDRPDKSLECYRNGLAEARALGDQSAVQFMEGAVATALLRSGKAAEAVPIFEGILAKNPEPYIARFRLATLADAYLEVGRPADALAAVDKALALDQSQPDALATFQFTRARANAALGRQDDAIADARTTLATYERVRESLLPLDFVKRGYSDLIQGVFDFTVGALEEAGRHAEALETAEAARGRALADLMASRQSVSSDGAPAAVSNREAADAAHRDRRRRRRAARPRQPRGPARVVVARAVVVGRRSPHDDRQLLGGRRAQPGLGGPWRRRRSSRRRCR